MAFVYYNPNPKNQRVGDCAIRAISKAVGKEWEEAYIALCTEGLFYSDMPSANYVWGMFLRKYGFTQKSIDSICPRCTTVAQFADEHPNGCYVLTCQSHVVTVKDGCYFDSWDSGDEVILYYFEKEFDYGL